MSRHGVKKYFQFIKNRVSSDWKDLAWRLGFEASDTENIESKRRDDKSRCMELLQQWHKQKGNVATIQVLMKALKDAKLKLVVDNLKDKYPELNEKPKSTTSSSKQKVKRKSKDNKRKAPQHDEAGQSNKRFKTNPGRTETPVTEGTQLETWSSLSTDLPVHLNLGVASTTARGQAGGINVKVLERLLELERTLFTIDVLRDRKRYEETREIFLSHKALLKDAIAGSFLLLLTFLRQTDLDRFYHNHYRVGEGTLSQQLSHILISDDLQDKVKGAQLIVRLQVKHEDYEQVRDRLGQGLDRTTSVDNLLALPRPSRHVDHSNLRGLDLAVIGQEDELSKSTDETDDITMPYRQVQSAIRTAREKSKVQPWVRKVRFGGRGSRRGEFLDPLGVAVSHDNEVYIADYVNTRIQVFAMDGVYIREFTTVTLPGETGETVEPNDVAVDRNDNLWVVSKDRVVQYSKEGTCLATIVLPYVGYIRGITVSMATDQVIVTEYDGQNGRLRVFNQDGSEVGTNGSPGHRSREPWKPGYVTVDGEGNILVTYTNNHCVHVFDREWNFKFKFGDTESNESHGKLWYPKGIYVDVKGNIIVADSGNGRVKMFDSQGRLLCDIGSGMKEPWAVTVSPGGDVVVTDEDNQTVSVWRQARV
ncbi:uncharacterized protein LOC144914486 [Branchiostoma floridae x Branchiostoma belcheri]